MSEKGEIINLNYSIKRKQKVLMDEIKETEIDQFIGIVYNRVTDKQAREMEEDTKGIRLQIIRPNLNYELFLKRHDIIGLQTEDDILKYQILLQDEHSLTNLFNFQRLFRTDDYITEKISKNIQNCPSIEII